MSKEQQVRQASADFYAALNQMANGNAGPMREVWANSADATAQHPIGGRDEGSDAVLASFSKVAEVSGGGSIRVEAQRFDVGEQMAVETGVERGSITIGGREATIEQRVTNVYCLEAGRWLIRHHHTDVSASLLDALAALEGA